MKVTTTHEVDAVFAAYPDFVRDKMQRLREPVIETAKETSGVFELEECL